MDQSKFDVQGLAILHILCKFMHTEQKMPKIFQQN